MADTAEAVSWTDDMVIFIISQWKEMKLKKLLDSKSKRNGLAYARMAANLKEEFEAVREVDSGKLVKSVQNKIKYLTKKYYAALAVKNKSGSGRDDHLKKCQFFEIIHEFLSDRPLTHPSTVYDSSSDRRRHASSSTTTTITTSRSRAPASALGSAIGQAALPVPIGLGVGPALPGVVGNIPGNIPEGSRINEPETYEHETIIDSHEQELERVDTPVGFPGHLNGPDDEVQPVPPVPQHVNNQQVVNQQQRQHQQQQEQQVAIAADPPRKQTKFETSMSYFLEKHEAKEREAENRFFAHQQQMQQEYLTWEAQQMAKQKEERREAREGQTQFQNSLLHMLGNLIPAPQQAQPYHPTPPPPQNMYMQQMPQRDGTPQILDMDTHLYSSL